MAALDLARSYIKRGWAPVPVPHRSKAPIIKAWQSLRITEADAARFFNGAAQNIGIILGPPSGGLTDVDLDCLQAVALAPYLLPSTDAIFGRTSKRASHWLYQTSLGERATAAARQFRECAGGPMLVELRIGGASGAQTVFPGSIHKDGERIEWERDGEPSKVNGDTLERAVSALSVAALLSRHWPSTQGSRHNAALVVGGFLARAGWTKAEIGCLVFAVACVAGDDEPEDRKQAAEDAAAAYRDGKNAYGLKTLRGVVGDVFADQIAEWAGYNRGHDHEPSNPLNDTSDVLTQDAVADAFAERHDGQLRYCHSTGAWFRWTGAHWQRDEVHVAFQFARKLGRELTAGGSNRALREVRKVAFAGGVEKFAQGDERLAVTVAAWDQDPLLLGTPRGTVDLRTGQLRTANPEEAITKVTAVAPSELADCSAWLRFLHEVTGGDVALIRFLQQWCGYNLTGITREQALVFVYGPGGNGKTVFLNVLTAILKDYAGTAPMETFTASSSDRHPTELAMLRGARLVTASETEEGRAWAENRIKQMTGGDPISARFMRQDFFTYKPQFKLTIIGNHKPLLRNVDDAARRRFIIVPFVFKPAIPDHDLEQKLQAEWPAILRWMIDGCLDWQANRLLRPESVLSATSDYFGEQDIFAHWLEEACDAEPGNQWKTAKAGELYASWAVFARASGEIPGSTKSFSAELQKRHFVPSRGTGGVRIFKGIRLRQERDGRLRSDG